MPASKGRDPHGRSTPNWRRLVTNLRLQRRPCRRCGQPIDYSLQWPDPASFSGGHVLPIETHPHLAEDPGNVDAEHLICNQSGGKKRPPPALGRTSRDW